MRKAGQLFVRKMALMAKPKRPVVSTWKLAPLRQPELHLPSAGGLAGRVIPFLLPLLLSGFTTSVWLLLLASVSGAIWAQFSLWKVTRFIGIAACNELFSKGPHQRPRIADFAVWKAGIEADRERLVKGTTSIVFAAFWLVLILFFGVVSDLIFARAFAAERDDVYRNLRPTPARPSEESLSSPEITLKNNSATDIRLVKFSCYAPTMHLDNGMTLPRTAFGHDLARIHLIAGGSGESLTCTPNNIITLKPPAATTCADITWWIDYVLADQPRTLQTKPFRLVLQAGHKQWEEVSLDAPTLQCPGDPKVSGVHAP